MEQSCQDWENCVGLLKLMNNYDKALVETRSEQKLICDKLDDLTNEVREMKQTVGSDLDKRIDERVENALNKQKALILKWLIGVAVSSGTLGSILTLLFH